MNEKDNEIKEINLNENTPRPKRKYLQGVFCSFLFLFGIILIALLYPYGSYERKTAFRGFGIALACFWGGLIVIGLIVSAVN